jgi:hypothetical protein
MTLPASDFLANFIARQNLYPIIAIGISRIAKNTENRIMEPAIITNSSGMTIMLGRFEEIRIALRDVEIKVTAYYSC